MSPFSRLRTISTLLTIFSLTTASTAAPIISEFLASNSTGLRDEDGERNDWIEIFNPDSTAVNLAGWYLTDRAATPLKWAFPAVSLAPKSYLLVWASEKNRAVAGQPLHTNFKLSASGEYLALLQPDGNISQQFAPTFPPQIADVAYGSPIQENTTVLVGAGTAAKFHVPANGSQGATWQSAGFDDTSWASKSLGIGYDRPLQPVTEVKQYADSVLEFSGTQGQNNWHYGYWDRTADANKAYAAGDFTAFSTAVWTGAAWDINTTGAPWTEMAAGGGHPNKGAGNEHWTVRRYVTEFSGNARFVGSFGDGAECGDGVALRVYVEGVQVYYRATYSAAPVEFTISTPVETGDRVDFVIDPLGNDACDGHSFSVKVWNGVLADSVADFSTTGQAGGSRGWNYGYYRRSADADGVYQTANFTQFLRDGTSTVSATNAWNGSEFQLSTTSPVTRLNAAGGTPSVTGFQDWPARRWTANFNGRVRIGGSVGHVNAGSNGIIAKIFVNGTQVLARTANNVSEGYSVFADVVPGTLVDFLLDPNSAETLDAGSIFTAVITPASSTATVLSDSIAAYGTGTQGTSGWSYGYYNKTTDADGNYAASDFNTTDVNWTLSGGVWRVGPGDPPWTFLNNRGGHPNGVNNTSEQWPIRRYTASQAGPLSVEFSVAKQAVGGTGVTVQVYHNGSLKGASTIVGTDRTGSTSTADLGVVAVGDTVDIALLPIGTGGATDDGSDGTFYSARILGNASNPNATLSLLADSTADWSTTGTQGTKGWHYGYYNRTLDPGGVYAVSDFTAFLNNGSNIISASNHWNGGGWDLNPVASGPWTELGVQTTHPNGVNSGQEHWTIRRWTNSHAGSVAVTYRVWKTNPNGTGVSIRAFVNGVEKDSVTIAGADSTGVTRTFVVENAAVGDTIDVGLTPVGVGGATDDGADGSAFTVSIHKLVAFSDSVNGSGNVLADMAGVNATSYTRVPFYVPGGGLAFDRMQLRMRYDDGYVAYLNGVELSKRNAPEAAVGGFFADSAAEFSGTQGLNGWFYGIWNRAGDANGTYEVSDFTTTHPGWGFNGNWVITPGNPPWTGLYAAGGHPNGTNSTGGHQQPIRRWISETNGTVVAHVRLVKAANQGGSGVTVYLYLNGAIVWQKSITGNDAIGVTEDVAIPGVKLGDSIDLGMDSRGVDGDLADSSDGTTLYMTIDQQPSAGLTWNAKAVASRITSSVGVAEITDLTAQRGLFQAGTNLLAFHGLNAGKSDNDFLLAPEVVGITVTANPAVRQYFVLPTPATANGTGTNNIGPQITDVTDSPVATDAVNLSITARVTPTVDPVASVTLSYRTMYGPEASIAMRDDGLNGDTLANDGVYAATIPETTYTAGQMVRWRVVALDSTGDIGRSPLFNDPLNSPEYWGTVVSIPNVVSGGQLPILHWFTNNEAAHDGGGGRCAIYFNGTFLDNVLADIHGQSSQGFPKKSHDFDLNTGYKLEWDVTPNNTTPKVNSFNLLTTYPDKAYLRNILAYEVLRNAGVPAHWAQAVQVRRNNAFYAVSHMVEDGDADYLQRAASLDSEGALYKMYNSFDNPNPTPGVGAEKKTRKYEDHSDITAFMASLLQTGAAKENFLFDNAGVPETLNYIAASILTGNDDCCHKNYYVYRDSEGNREWRPLPWDVDLSLGRVWRGGIGYFQDAMEPATSLFVGNGNRFMTPFLDNSVPRLRQMYLRRLRTLIDKFLQPAATPLAERYWEARMNHHAALVFPDANFEKASTTWGTWGTAQTPDQALVIMRDQYVPARRNWVYSQPEIIGTPAQAANVVVNFGTVEFDPASHNQDQEYFTLVNPNTVAVDISDWVISGAVNHTLKPGTVIPANGTLHLSPNVNAFRARTVGPRGGQGLFVQGNYNGQLSARGETLQLHDGLRLVASTTYLGTPSLAQQHLRIAEMHYNPAPLDPDTFNPGEYEFLELVNTSSSQAVPLTGVWFSNGITFQFTSGTLAASGRAILVKNQAAFAQRHPGVDIAGTFTGTLDNAGERITLLDANNEEVLDFSYSPLWWPATAGGGFSLQAASETQEPDLWSLKLGWKPSGTIGGSISLTDSKQDTDKDGRLDYDEWLAGTNAYNANDAFQISPVSVTNGVLRGSFPAVTGKRYCIEVSNNLQPGSWTPLLTHTATEDGQVEFEDPAFGTNGHRYYRALPLEVE